MCVLYIWRTKNSTGVLDSMINGFKGVHNNASIEVKRCLPFSLTGIKPTLLSQNDYSELRDKLLRTRGTNEQLKVRVY